MGKKRFCFFELHFFFTISHIKQMVINKDVLREDKKPKWFSVKNSRPNEKLLCDQQYGSCPEKVLQIKFLL